MATLRNHHFIAAAWILLTQRILSSGAFSSSSGILIPRTEAAGLWPRRRDDAPRRAGAALTPTSLTLPTKRRGAYSSSSSSSLREEASARGTGIEGGESSMSSSSPSATAVRDGSTTANDDGGAPGDDGQEMPWSDAQEMALRDGLPKYAFFAPSPMGGGATRYARWRTMSREVPELAGYPPRFLRRMHRRGRGDDDGGGATTPGMLPMVDDFVFVPDGGIVGRVYGLPGVADGTIIRTPSLMRAERTVPLGYVTTTRGGGGGGEGSFESWNSGYDDDDDEDGVGLSYELGTMMSQSSSSSSSSSPSSAYSLDGTARSAALAAAARRLTSDGGGKAIAEYSSRQVVDFAKGVADTGSGLLTDAEANRDLVYLGGATAMLLAGASAVGALSHHLTLNVFWV